MKKHIIIAALLAILCFKTYSQIVFENGYFINESNQKINCLIKNIDWKNNPDEFEYKISQNESIQKADIQTIKEFGINGVSKYIRAKVKIDNSGIELNKLNSERNPFFQEKRLFLKVLIEGKASLFSFNERNFTWFFYKINDSEINQLVYKRYLDYKYNIAENNFFKQQLFNELKCQGITLNNVKYIKYNKKDLEQLFVNYNECTNSGYVNYESIQKKDLFNLSFRPGLNASNLAMQHSIPGFRNFDFGNFDFGNKLSFRFGIEAEFIFPFNKNKWGIIIEPTFQYFKSEKTKEVDDVSGGILVSKANYRSIELPVGVRHYFFFNDKSKIFINISFIIDFCNNSIIEFARSDGSILNSLEIKSRNNIALGIGYKYKDRYSIEMRYQTSREILGDQPYWNSDYTTLSMILGYSLF